MKTATLLFLLASLASMSSPPALAARDGAQLLLAQQQAAPATKPDTPKATTAVVYWDSRRTPTVIR
jgi:hypothetical protein